MGDEVYWVIVVDDDISNLKVAGSILSENGIRVTALGSGQALLDRVASDSPPDLILLDVLMPVMDGFETFGKLRQFERDNSRKEIPVVFLTAEENDDTREKAVSLGAADIVRKPFDADMLVGRIEDIISGGGSLAQTADTPHAEQGSDEQQFSDLRRLCESFDERSAERGAYCPDRNSFGAIYRYMLRHVSRYNGNIRKVLITMRFASGMPGLEKDESHSRFEQVMSGVLRNSDVVLSVQPDKFLVLLPMVSEDDLGSIMGRISSTWKKESGSDAVTFDFVSECAGNKREKRPDVKGLDYRYAHLNLPTDKMLTDTMTDFTNSMPDRLERLNTSFADIDSPEALNAYRIEVHAMKSSSAMIGLMQLSGLARLLEGWANDDDTDRIKTLHPIFSEEWRSSYEELAGALGLEIRSDEKNDGAEALPALLGVLRDAVDNMDTESVDRALTKISSYSYDEKTAQAIEKLKRAAIEFDDSAFDIIKELLQ